jgi:hypothetical protein
MPSAKIRHRRNSQCAVPPIGFWMCGSRSLGPQVVLSGSGTECGFSSASHRCCSISAAVGRWVGSTVRHALTKSLAVLDAFAPYSPVWHGLYFHLLLLVFAVEWRIASEQEVRDHTHGPYVHWITMTGSAKQLLVSLHVFTSVCGTTYTS